MYFLGLGLLLLALELLYVDPVAAWSWWAVLSPFALAVVWWAWADASGYTKRKEMEKMDAIREERIQRQRDALKNKSARPR